MSVEPAIEAAVLFSDADGIRRITLNRPEAANALRPVDRDRLAVLIEKHRAARYATVKSGTATPASSRKKS